ncbi:hypothetical protein TNCV_5112581 [Trichonephila clavipes]|nr:hypothetical protein TNCV_5112581 [Trichonephila clavipes]
MHRGKKLEVRLSLALALSTIQVTVRVSSAKIPEWTIDRDTTYLQLHNLSERFLLETEAHRSSTEVHRFLLERQSLNYLLTNFAVGAYRILSLRDSHRTRNIHTKLAGGAEQPFSSRVFNLRLPKYLFFAAEVMFLEELKDFVSVSTKTDKDFYSNHDSIRKGTFSRIQAILRCLPADTFAGEEAGKDLAEKLKDVSSQTRPLNCPNKDIYWNMHFDQEY